jgi:hypothetical protein
MRTDAPTPPDAAGALNAATMYPPPTSQDFTTLQSDGFAHTDGAGALGGPDGEALVAGAEVAGALWLGASEADAEPLGKSRLELVDGGAVTPTRPDPDTVEEQPAARSSTAAAHRRIAAFTG